jgi:hypothetical protein
MDAKWAHAQAILRIIERERARLSTQARVTQISVIKELGDQTPKEAAAEIEGTPSLQSDPGAQ